MGLFAWRFFVFLIQNKWRYPGEYFLSKLSIFTHVEHDEKVSSHDLSWENKIIDKRKRYFARLTNHVSADLNVLRVPTHVSVYIEPRFSDAIKFSYVQCFPNRDPN